MTCLWLGPHWYCETKDLERITTEAPSDLGHGLADAFQPQAVVPGCDLVGRITDALLGFCRAVVRSVRRSI
jgi:hypothetical protein